MDIPVSRLGLSFGKLVTALKLMDGKSSEAAGISSAEDFFGHLPLGSYNLVSAEMLEIGQQFDCALKTNLSPCVPECFFQNMGSSRRQSQRV